MKFAPTRTLAFAALALGVLIVGAVPASAQAFPSGSYQRSCNDIHWAGTTLVAECRKRDGRMGGTALGDALRCKGDIANDDGRLQCASGPPRAAGPPPTQGFGSPPREPNYPAPGYRDYGERRSGDYDERRGRCEQIRERRRELRDRLEYASWEDRGRLEYRLRELGEERERLGCLR